MRLYILSLLFCLASTGYSQSVKMKITGVTAASGEDVLAFQTVVNVPVTTGSGGVGTGAPAFDAIEFKKVNNTSTNVLFQRSLAGTYTTDVTFEFTDAGGTMYYKIVIREVAISKFSYLVPECNGCTKMYHDIKMVFNKIEVTDVATGNTLKYNLTNRTFY